MGDVSFSLFIFYLGLTVKLRFALDSMKRLADSSIVHPFRI